MGLKKRPRDRRTASGPAHRIHLPGFVRNDHIGLGDVVKRVTHAAGITPCGACERRAAALNRWLVFTGRGR